VSNSASSVGTELLNVPFPEMVLKLATAIAEGQYNLDRVSCEIAKLMGDQAKVPISLPNYNADGTVGIPLVTSMIGAGFQPTFYQFTDTIIEVKMAITMTKSTEASVSSEVSVKLWSILSASVNASYASKYSYKVEGSSLLRTKITPVPPNAFLSNYLETQGEILRKALIPAP